MKLTYVRIVGGARNERYYYYSSRSRRCYYCYYYYYHGIEIISTPCVIQGSYGTLERFGRASVILLQKGTREPLVTYCRKENQIEGYARSTGRHPAAVPDTRDLGHVNCF